MRKITITLCATALVAAPALAQDSGDTAQPGTSAAGQADKPAAGPDEETSDAAVDKPASAEGAEPADEGEGEGEAADKPADDNPEKLG